MATRTPTPTLPPETPPDGDRSFWASKWTILSVILVGLIVVAGAWTALDDPDPARPAAPGDRAESLPADVGDPCGPDGTGSQIPPAETPETRWVLLGSMAAPTDPAIGPAAETDGVPQCFAPDPSGALFAAATFVAVNTDPELRVAALDQLVAEGAGRDAAAADIASRGPGGRTVGVQIAGFSFLSYSEAEAAVIDLALLSEGVLVHAPIELAWTGEDWRVVLPPTGRPFDAIQAIPSLAGYTTWQGA